ncbi:cyclohexanecarboxylate-CoA ligase [Streptomyces mashuensis]|uniref:Cyclohexanecarboxylate-CoA ligase n=1 Tax=Streptomyces mashuensis TaxID=33904 RepID=A0A919B6B3_9ACTN|nr:AMP-binding protein [Streptomyces mashuensis]GHF57861.1 cyclohexanecarboxylate-CoA ligase [Streptomyces mashuensis]
MSHTRTIPALVSSRTLWELVEQRAALTPHAPALLQATDPAGDAGAAQEPPGTDDRRLSFAALRERAERVAAWLHTVGVRPGSRFVWQLPTRIETVVLSLALARLGAVQSPLITACRDHEAGHALKATGAGFCAVPGEWRGFDHSAMARRLARALRVPPLVLHAYEPLPEADPAVLPPPPDGGDRPRWVHWTSGTTAAPKGVLHTDRSLIRCGAALTDALGLGPGDVGSIAFPYGHVGGVVYTMAALLSGMPVLLVEHFALPGSLGAYRRNGVTVAGGSTAFYELFLAAQRKQPGRRIVPTLRLLAGGGAPRPPELHEAVAKELGCELAHGYGMTEAPVITMGAPGEDPPERLAGSEGRPAAGVEVRVTGPGGGPVPDGAQGEVRIRGEAVCRGYLDPAATAESFDADGFLRTGDVGRFTADGYLVLTGRVKDVVIRKGETVSAAEVEQLVRTHPAVADVAVIGLPDAVRGERVCAVIQQRAGAVPLTLPAVVAHLRAAGLAAHKLPEQLELVDELPRDGTLRKVRKDRLRERFRSGPV